MTKRTYQVGPCMELLGNVVSQLRLDAISLRRKGVLDDQGKLTREGNRRFPRSTRNALNHNRITGLQRRDEVETIGRMVYQGGVARLFERLGLPDIQEEFKRNVETQTVRTMRRPR